MSLWEGDATTLVGAEMIGKPDRLEIWLGDKLMFGADSSYAPQENELINIRKITYRVVDRSFTVDHADEMHDRQVRCKIIVEPLK